MTEWEQTLITTQRVARLATVDSDGRPHAVPIVYAFDGNRLYTPIDEKPKRVEAYELQRVKNIRANPHVVVLIDIYSEDWEQLVWVQVRGTATVHEPGDTPRWDTGVQLLHEKYSQYDTMPLTDRPLIVITPDKTVSWRATSTTHE